MPREPHYCLLLVTCFGNIKNGSQRPSFIDDWLETLADSVPGKGNMTFAGRAWWAASAYANFLIAYSLGAGLLPEPTGPGPSCLSIWSPVHSRRAQPVGLWVDWRQEASLVAAVHSALLPQVSAWVEQAAQVFSPVSAEVGLALPSLLASKMKTKTQTCVCMCGLGVTFWHF